LSIWDGQRSVFGPLDRVQYKLLKRIAPVEPFLDRQSVYQGHSKLRMLLGEELVHELLRCDKVIDFGCGGGDEAIELAELGCKRVIGLDIQENLLARARVTAERRGVSHKCEFLVSSDEPADAIVSLDAFEHFGEPEKILAIMYRLLRPGGFVAASFGPTWFHPTGGHLFSVFPWAHLIFSEAALCRWRADLRDDGATRFGEVAGGLNQMTVRRFETMVASSGFMAERLDCVPIRKLHLVHNRLTREWTTAIVRVLLRKPS
jgi:SAM-dependent methyltransferase